MSLAGMAIWKMAFQLSPIFLTGGSSWISQVPGGTVPIILLTEPLSAISSIISGSENKELDGFFAHFQPMPGSTLVDNQIAMYPFANQAVAANAMITQPLQISMRMVCPVKVPFGYALKLATMEILQGTLADHNRSGGTYTVVTPSFFYTNCLMTRMVDISGGESAQAQHTWQLDFVRPLLTVEAAIAQGSTNPLMSKMQNGGQVDALPQADGTDGISWSGESMLTGTNSAGQSTSGLSPSGLIGPDPSGTSVGPPAIGGAGNQALQPVFNDAGGTIGAQTPGFVLPPLQGQPALSSVLTPGAFGS